MRYLDSVGARRILIAFTGFAMASAGGAALADAATTGQANSGGLSSASQGELALMTQGINAGLDTVLGDMVAETTPQSALPPKRITAEDRRAARPERPPTLPKNPTPEEIAAMPAASAGTNGTSKRPSAEERQFASQSAVAEITNTPPHRVAVMLGDIAVPPASAPARVVNAINSANTLVGQPYVLGGGHASFYSRGYDCSGAVSFALAGAGFLQAPLVSGQLENWGAPGPGKWITVYANAGHTYVVIAGLRFDTAGEQRGTGPRWHVELPYPDGYVARHPPGF